MVDLKAVHLVEELVALTDARACQSVEMKGQMMDKLWAQPMDHHSVSLTVSNLDYWKVVYWADLTADRSVE